MMLPTSDDVALAARRLEGFAVKTPVIESPRLNALCGGRVLVKAECLQRTGSFKFRGAWNCISQLDAASAPGGVVAYSSGNHAQGVAAAAAIRRLPALIVMPADTPRIKQDNTRQGTAGLELAEEARLRGVTLDAVLVCCSGGGLTAGITLAMAAASPATRVHPVEPAGFDDYARSLASGRIEANAKPSGSICDALMSVSPGEMTFAINQHRVGEGLTVTDTEAAEAMRFAFAELKLVLEPGGAVALAAALHRRIGTQGRTIGVIASGGNCDADMFARVLRREI